MTNEPDAFEKRVRFGCGFSFGAGVFFLVALREIGEFTGGFWVFVISAAILCGVVALRYGDEFWRQITRWFP